MRTIDADKLIEQLDGIQGIQGIGMEAVMAVRDIKDMIRATPTEESVPLDELCKWMAGRYAVPCRSFEEPEELFCGPCYQEGITNEECWKRYFRKRMGGMK